MGRTIDELPDGGYRTECVSTETCKHEYNEICCCDKSELCCDYADFEYCIRQCPYFEAEDMQEGDVIYEQITSE